MAEFYIYANYHTYAHTTMQISFIKQNSKMEDDEEMMVIMMTMIKNKEKVEDEQKE